ncbi:MAG: tyrosine-type recombinase/integrase [Actinomycetales bacterium]|nr:tyrosine-type recombinase/integrase [Actinomycetales bacterium]
MGYVIERVDGSGRKRYTAMYRDIRGRRRSAGTFGSPEAARREAIKAEARLDAGKIGDPKRGRQSLRHYVEVEWFPHHVLEAKTRENYTYLLDRYILPELGDIRMVELLPSHVREWVARLQTVYEARPPSIRAAKVVLDAILTTALNDQITFLHAGRGVKTPAVAKKPKRIVTTEQFDAIYEALSDATMRLLVETDIESGLRWGELTELRVKDLDFSSGLITVARAVVELKAKTRPDGVRFVVKDYPKDREWRQVKLARHILAKLDSHITGLALGPDDLLFEFRQSEQPHRRTLPDHLPAPATLGLTEPNEKGRQYPHGTPTAYGAGRCRCRHCKNAVAAYRAARRNGGKDQPRSPRTVATDGHIPGDWFRKNVWAPALRSAGIGVHVTPHGLRHAHASWLLAGGADLQVVKERLGHGSITTTEKYLHTLPGAHDAALDALDSVRGVREPTETNPSGTQPEALSASSHDAELTELRNMVTKMSRMLASLGDTA